MVLFLFRLSATGVCLPHGGGAGVETDMGRSLVKKHGNAVGSAFLSLSVSTQWFQRAVESPAQLQMPLCVWEVECGVQDDY